jgi:hypothetical protein
MNNDLLALVVGVGILVLIIRLLCMNSLYNHHYIMIDGIFDRQQQQYSRHPTIYCHP